MDEVPNRDPSRPYLLASSLLPDAKPRLGHHNEIPQMPKLHRLFIFDGWLPE